MLRATTYGPWLLLTAAVAWASGASGAPAKNHGYEILHSFTGGADGAKPYGTLLPDTTDGKGTFYGTASAGGFGVGTLYKLAPDGTLTVLHTFANNNEADGSYPFAGVIRGKGGALYGTTLMGSAFGGNGTIYKVAPDGTETVLHYFSGANSGDGDGGEPYYAGLVRDKAGNLYGTTENGGANGDGLVFKFTPKGIETVLHNFAGGSDGANPYGGNLILDNAGNLYGMTSAGGTSGAGTVYRIAPDGTETVLYSFSGGSDGATPYGGVIADASGNLYGMTSLGGASNKGTVFKLAPDGTETVVHSFAGGSDGYYPTASLIADKKGNLYGATEAGGGSSCNGVGCGTVFKLAPDGAETTLHAFTGGSDGIYPSYNSLIDVGGYLYGTTAYGGGIGCDGGTPTGCGTIFRVKK